MEKFYIAARYLHIVAGVVAFFVAPIAFISRKGGPIHIVWGNIFFLGHVGGSFYCCTNGTV